jgi:hypothetical protein
MATLLTRTVASSEIPEKASLSKGSKRPKPVMVSDRDLERDKRIV